MLLDATKKGMDVLCMLKYIGGSDDVSLRHIHFIAPISIDEFNTSLFIFFFDALTSVHVDKAELLA